MLAKNFSISPQTISHSSLLANSSNLAPPDNLKAKGGKSKHTASFLNPSSVLDDGATGRKRRKMEKRECDVSSICMRNCHHLFLLGNGGLNSKSVVSALCIVLSW